MKTLLTVLFFAAALQAQTLTVTLQRADGTTVSKALTGQVVAAGLEVLDGFRAANCTSKAADGTCTANRFPDTTAVIFDILVGKILELSDTYPTSATLAARTRKSQAQAEIDATKAALASAAKPQ